ncbi:hypothetical protein IE53DRAFT_337920 [Violaceomyces palustris]|uniref:Uncharacterized protein n=1 Tax=Violaceomyces palustris TaxID=1673888 RepID=A0ACD0P737_9BASI|nr:hypothetical protein IE53DRAFT_337920 [Violaceomyces palustris]
MSDSNATTVAGCSRGQGDLYKNKILLAYPESAFASDSKGKRLLVLPHPRTGNPSYFLPYHPSESPHPTGSSDQSGGDRDLKGESEGGILQLQVIRQDKSERSWFISGADDDDGDGALHLLTPIDPIFLLLPILYSVMSDAKPPFLPLEDLFDQAALNLYRSRISKHAERMDRIKKDEKLGGISSCSTASKNGRIGSGGGTGLNRLDGTEGEGGAGEGEEEMVWEDVIRFGRTLAAKRGLERICQVQEISPTLNAYRISHPKLFSVLGSKLERLSSEQTFSKSPNTLGRALNRRLERDGDEGEALRLRRQISFDVLEGFLNQDVARAWKAELERT